MDYPVLTRHGSDPEQQAVNSKTFTEPEVGLFGHVTEAKQNRCFVSQQQLKDFIAGPSGELMGMIFDIPIVGHQVPFTRNSARNLKTLCCEVDTPPASIDICSDLQASLFLEHRRLYAGGLNHRVCV